MEDTTENTTAATKGSTAGKAGGRMITQRRDASSAMNAAKARLENAQNVAAAVEAYHSAADRIDAANAELTAAGEDRLAAIRKLRQCGLTISEIGELTGLSASRIQALSRDV